ncbi:MAG: hypothetical protein ACLR0U_28035 [Enterocloster clostridioformis]
MLTPQYSWGRGNLLAAHAAKGRLPHIGGRGSSGETDTRKSAAILTSTSRTAIRMKLTPPVSNS